MDCPVDSLESVKAIRAIVVIASSLSILGALAIILVSYCKGESMRKENTELDHSTQLGHSESTMLQSPTQTDSDDDATDTDVRNEERNKKTIVQYPARLIIACISAADMIVAVSHIWGVTKNYLHQEQHSSANVHSSQIHHNYNITAAENSECGAQAALSIFGALSSFLWSDLLALMAVVMLRSSSKRWFKPANFITYRAFVVYNIICWGIPLLVVCVLGGVNAIGFEDSVDVGWCYMYTPVHRGNKKRSMGLMVFGYDFWVLGSMLWILVMGLTFCFMYCAKKIKRRRIKDAPAGEEGQQLLESVIVDERAGCCKRSCLRYSKPLIMIIAATSLILLRVWSTALDFLHFKGHFHCKMANPVILSFAGFGNSAQGLVNFFIFVVITGQGRKFVSSLCGCKKQKPSSEN